MRKSSVLAAFAAVIMTGAMVSEALAGCHQCYRQEIVSAQYRTAQYTLLVSPGRVVPYRVPARFGTVQEAVMISPARKVWQRAVDAYGRETLCLVTVAPRYGVTARTVLLEPARVVTGVVPPEYATFERVEIVAPAQAYWAPARYGDVSTLY